MNVETFQELIWQKGRELYRSMPWRDNTDPYHVLVSELMLQQTQVDRVIPKFQQFLVAFPTVRELADASLGEVLRVWSGLGYNRRAKYLHEAARAVVADGGTLPRTLEALVALPGVGPNTAGAILAYSYNQAVVFVETNIRTVYFHHWFGDRNDISDSELCRAVAATLDQEHPREWYWALMDYGAFLKKQGAGAIDRSRHYHKQAPLKGSVREVRGFILKQLAHAEHTRQELAERVPDDDRFDVALAALQDEKLIAETDGRFHLAR